MKNRLLSIVLLLFTACGVSGQVPSYVPTNGLVGWWPFNGNANDESGNGVNLTPQGSAVLSLDRFNNENSSYYFSGSADPSNLNFPSSSILTINNFSEGTISFWLNIHQFNVSNHYFGFDNSFFVKQKGGVNTQLYCGILGGTQKFRFHLDGALPSGSVFSSTSDILLNQWTNISISWDGSYQKIYINGLLDNQISSPSFLSDLSNADFINIGAIPVGSNGAYSDLDDFGIWNRALTADEVLELYNGCNVTPQVIAGNATPSAFANSTYTCNNTAGSTYSWTVNNGVIVSGQGTNTVNVLWASTGIGNVSVVETTAEGCVGTTLSQDVVVIPVNVEELSNAFIVYPNPVTTELNLQTTTELIGKDLVIFDALGKQIMKQQILSTNTIINTSSFAAGNYVVKIGEGVKRFEVRR